MGILNRVADEVATEQGVNTLVVNWWIACADDTQAVFGNAGGHAGENETAFIQAINPAMVKKELNPVVTTTTIPPSGTWSATPFPSSVLLYKKGEGANGDFDQKKADEYLRRVNVCVATIVKDVLEKWTAAGFE